MLDAVASLNIFSRLIAKKTGGYEEVLVQKPSVLVFTLCSAVLSTDEKRRPCCLETGKTAKDQEKVVAMALTMRAFSEHICHVVISQMFIAKMTRERRDSLVQLWKDWLGEITKNTLGLPHPDPCCRSPCQCPSRCRGWWRSPAATEHWQWWRAGRARSLGCYWSACRQWTSSGCQRWVGLRWERGLSVRLMWEDVGLNLQHVSGGPSETARPSLLDLTNLENIFSCE